jgi:hypothetical protein
LALVITGFPDTTKSARSWSGPGVRISSASTAIGNASRRLGTPPILEWRVVNGARAMSFG